MWYSLFEIRPKLSELFHTKYGDGVRETGILHDTQNMDQNIIPSTKINEVVANAFLF